MRFDIVGIDENYGKHRFSNNDILRHLALNSQPSSELAFVWWVEKMFLGSGYSETVDRLTTSPWFGVMHVPLLTPNWAMYSQNNLAKLHFMPKWREAMEHCVGIITLSGHMQRQLKALYPKLKVYSLKHPIGSVESRFDIRKFRSDPSFQLVGAWLRDFDWFERCDVPFRKRIVFNQYAQNHIQQRYEKYRPGMLGLLKNLENSEFLTNEDYDKVLTSSLLCIALHETSANNAVCECLAYRTPFLAYRHPAIEEYVGSNYPLFIDDIDLASLSFANIEAASAYLEAQVELRNQLSYESFLDSFKKLFMDCIA
jgi:hypothetical protein